MTGWSDLAAELDAWGEAGTTVEFWLRDDDAGAAAPALKRLVEICISHDIPASFATIPTLATTEAAELIADLQEAGVLVHGYAHTDHSGPAERKTEYSHFRDSSAVAIEWREALRLVQKIFGPQAIAVFVPPWNRIAPSLKKRLAETGFGGFSGLGNRNAAREHNLAVTNVHVDLYDSRKRSFRGEAATLDQLVGHLSAKRAGSADAAEATGIMTHHLDFDEDCWWFLNKLIASTRHRSGVRWLSAADIFRIAT